MVRCSHAFLPFFLLTCALVQRSYCSRPFPKELPKPAAPSVAHGGELRRDEARDRPMEETIAGRGANADHGAAPPSSATTLAVDGGDGVAGPRRRWGGALAQAARDSVLHFKKLARRFLVAGEGTDSAAGPSCRSNNVHNTCSPPPPH